MEPLPLFALRCSQCGTSYPEEALPATCPNCPGTWTYDLPPNRLNRLAPLLEWAAPGPESGIRRWSRTFGLRPEELPDRPLSRPVGRHQGIWVSQQGSAPAGSYKERGAEVLAATCVRRRIDEVFVDSSGNAGLAVARACQARGIRCRVLVPKSTPEEKLRQIRAWGAQVVVIPGDRQATYQAAQELRSRLPYASHIFQPFFHAGVATLIWDLREDLQGELPSHIFLPVGNGSLLLGVVLGLDLLNRAGKLSRLPRLHAVQLQGYAALHPQGPGTPRPGPPVAAGIAIAHPPRKAKLRRLLSHRGGDVTVVAEDDIAQARRTLAEAGYPTDPTGAAAYAGWLRRADLPPEDCLVLLTSREGPGGE